MVALGQKSCDGCPSAPVCTNGTKRPGWLLPAVALGVFVVTAVFALLHDADIDPRPRFLLINQDGVPTDERLLLENWNLVYFGFTNCPQVCPTQMAKVTAALHRVDAMETGVPIMPIFITVDPQRDDPPAIRAYLTHFHQRFVGLTGDADALRAAAGAFRAIAGRANGDGNHPDVQHSSAVYLVNPDGKIVTYLPYGATVPELVAGVQAYLP